MADDSSGNQGGDDFFIPTTGRCNKTICTGAIGHDHYLPVTVSERTWRVKSTEPTQMSALRALVNAYDDFLKAIGADSDTMSRQSYEVAANFYRADIATDGSVGESRSFRGACNKSICTPGVVGTNQTRVSVSARSWFVNPQNANEVTALAALKNLLGVLISTSTIEMGRWIQADISEATWLVENGSPADTQLTALKNAFRYFLSVLELDNATEARQNIRPPHSDAPD